MLSITDYTQIERLAPQKWVRPNVPKHTSLELLQSYKDGTFLVRISLKRKQFVLTKKKDANTIAHTYILRSEKGYGYSMKKFLNDNVHLLTASAKKVLSLKPLRN